MLAITIHAPSPAAAAATPADGSWRLGSAPSAPGFIVESGGTLISSFGLVATGPCLFAFPELSIPIRAGSFEFSGRLTQPPVRLPTGVSLPGTPLPLPTAHFNFSGTFPTSTAAVGSYRVTVDGGCTTGQVDFTATRGSSGTSPVTSPAGPPPVVSVPTSPKTTVVPTTAPKVVVTTPSSVVTSTPPKVVSTTPPVFTKAPPTTVKPRNVRAETPLTIALDDVTIRLTNRTTNNDQVCTLKTQGVTSCARRVVEVSVSALYTSQWPFTSEARLKPSYSTQFSIGDPPNSRSASGRCRAEPLATALWNVRNAGKPYVLPGGLKSCAPRKTRLTFTKDVDVIHLLQGGSLGGSLEVEFRIRDITGNEASVKKSLQFDQATLRGAQSRTCVTQNIWDGEFGRRFKPQRFSC